MSNLGSTLSERRYLRTVLRDSPVRRAISRIEKCCRYRQRRMTLSSSMTITPRSPVLVEGERFEHGSILGGKTWPAWVSSQWKSTAGLYEDDPKTGAPAPLIEVACRAHSRRKIYDVHVETQSPAAAQALETITRMFAIEADISGKSPAERVTARRAKATPILVELRAFLDATMAKVSGKSSLASAIRYAVSRWTALMPSP
jgi:hypothetical protein